MFLLVRCIVPKVNYYDDIEHGLASSRYQQRSLKKATYDVALALWAPAVVEVAMGKAVVRLGVSVLVNWSSTVESHVGCSREDSTVEV
ncbi:predicted protein [Lichtheimia corymbifera JMRC:FSU:9682]|uniref:Uncharacterized protein n=1 Tax=Lichtheimia corymbifera JMRC:FSU:9682 TaxID=1263082 RepID=A0A068RP78_9FUNG|nr:predicted protein [Lichtheimia corymbifera JMRC:FSU:9682]